MSARALLRDLRDQGVEVEAAGDRLRVRGPADVVTPAMQDTLRKLKPDLLAALQREEVERLLDLAPVDSSTGLPDLPANEPATVRQVERLRELAAHPAFGSRRSKVREIVEEAVEDGLSQLGAYGLLSELGRRIDQRRTT